MDRPLKYFLAITAIFIGLVTLILLATVTKNPRGELAVINPEDKLVIKAGQRAAETIDTLYKLYPSYPQNTFIRFSFKDAKKTKHIWGQVTALTRDHVSILTLKKTQPELQQLPDELDVPSERIEDWLVELKNGKVRGGFSTQAILIRQKEEGDKSAKIDSQLQLFVDPLD